MNTALVTRQLIAVAATTAALLSLQVSADNYSETLIKSPKAVRMETVSFDDLDLSSSKGQQSLYFRISSAARAVCGSSDHRITGHLRSAVDNQACYERAVSDALSQVNNPSQVATVD